MSRDTEDKLQDLTTYGVSFSKGGKRIDPRDVYISTEPEQEPVAWIYEWVDEAGEPVKSVAYNFYDDANPIPLYTAPQKRKHLTDIEISKGFKADDEATHLYSYWAGVEFAEKHHGIGEG